MKTNHTPGPWKVETYVTASYILPKDVNSNDHIATVTNTEHRLANAELIAAAPELLAALEGLMKRAAKDAELYAPEGNEPIWAFINDASDAIAKAKG